MEGVTPRPRVAALTAALLVAGCGAEALAPRPSDSPLPAASATATPRPTNAADDIVYVRSNGGPAPQILALDARTGATVRALADGVLTPDGGSVYWTEPSDGGRKTAIHRTSLATGAELGSFVLDGDLRLAGLPGTFEASGAGAQLTRDGRLLALARPPSKVESDWITDIAVADVRAGATVATAHFRGASTYGFVAMAPDGRTLFVEQYGNGATRTRALDLATGTLVDPAGSGLVSNGMRTPGVTSPDGRWLYRVDAGNPTTNCTSSDSLASCTPNGTAPYVIAVDLSARRAVRVPLSPRSSPPDWERNMLWSIAMTPDGATIYAANPALGVVDEIDAGALALRRTGQMPVARTDGLLDAVARFFLPVADAKRYLVSGAILSPDGRTLYVAAYGGLAVIDTATLRSRAVWQSSRQFDALRLSADGRRLYAMDNMAGKLVILDLATGGSLGEIKLGYVSAILRVEPR